MQYTENWGSYYKAKHIFFLINMSSDENLGFCAILLNVVYKSLSISFWRCLPMLGPLGEDFAKVKASITTALDKITQVLFFDSVKIRWFYSSHDEQVLSNHEIWSSKSVKLSIVTPLYFAKARVRVRDQLPKDEKRGRHLRVLTKLPQPRFPHQ